MGCVDILKISFIISVILRESEKSRIGDWRVYNDFRFFTPLRFVQNDKGMEVLRSEMTGD